MNWITWRFILVEHEILFIFVEYQQLECTGATAKIIMEEEYEPIISESDSLVKKIKQKRIFRRPANLQRNWTHRTVCRKCKILSNCKACWKTKSNKAFFCFKKLKFPMKNRSIVQKASLSVYKFFKTWKHARKTFFIYKQNLAMNKLSSAAAAAAAH